MTRTSLCVILARAGSKGLPGKNTMPIAGKPMVAWTIEYARSATMLDAVALSTEGTDIAKIGRDYEIEILARPAHLASDTASVSSAAKDAVYEWEYATGVAVDDVVILYGNVPVRPPGLIGRALLLLRDTECDSVQSVCQVGKMHPAWMKRVLPGYRMADLPGWPTAHRRQDLEPLYVLDGGIIAVTRESLFAADEGYPHSFLGEDRRVIVTQPGEVVDVDNAIDARLASAILSEHV